MREGERNVNLQKVRVVIKQAARMSVRQAKEIRKMTDAVPLIKSRISSPRITANYTKPNSLRLINPRANEYGPKNIRRIYIYYISL